MFSANFLPYDIIWAALFLTRLFLSSDGREGNRGVDKTRNMEHSGTSRNIPEHEKIKVIFMKKKLIKNNDNNNMVFVKINNNKIT